MSDKPTVTNDAIVTYDDAFRWVKELYPLPPNELESMLLQVEPAVTGVAVNLAQRLRARLIEGGVNEKSAADLAMHVERCGVICAEITRRGYQQFIRSTDTDEAGAE